jgi:hypothetical protein
MTEPEVTLQDVWQLLCRMDQSLTSDSTTSNVTSPRGTRVSLLSMHVSLLSA